MSRTVERQVSFADWELMRQGLRLEPLLQAISDFLDDQKDMIEQVRCDLTRGLKKAGTGRSGLTPQQILRSLVLMRIKNWDYRELRSLFVWRTASELCAVRSRGGASNCGLCSGGACSASAARSGVPSGGWWELKLA